jgi:tripartite-type tricarboxylate transporter receptor subunit TctC
VRFIIGYTPGGSADIAARLIGQWLSERLGQSFIVESRPVAGSNIGPRRPLAPRWLHDPFGCAGECHQCDPVP